MRVLSWLMGPLVVASLYRLGIPNQYRSHLWMRAFVFGLMNSLLLEGYGACLRFSPSTGAYAAGLQGVAATLVTLYLFSLCVLIAGFPGSTDTTQIPAAD